MATQPGTETKLTLEAPAPVAPVLAKDAAGLVPIEPAAKTQLDQTADAFVAELVALDSNSPEFGRKVDQLTDMGRKTIAQAAGASNRFLDKPVKAMDRETGIGNDLTRLRRLVEDLDPGKKGNLLSPKKIFGFIRRATSCAAISTITNPRKPTSPRSSTAWRPARTS
jgi:hypothetical protein